VAHAPEFMDKGGGFKAEYFSELALLEKSSFWFRSRNKLILWALSAYKSNAQNFLEVGCGTGFVLSGIAKSHPNMSLSGSEIFLAGLSYASARVPQAKLMQMDARQVPFLDEFDAIGAFDVLEHIEEDGDVLLQLYKAMKPQGVLLLTVPQHPNLWSASDEYACHVRRYRCCEVEAKVRGAGFNVLKSTSFVTLLLPAMMLSRWFYNKNKEVLNPAGELKISPLLNLIFYAFMIFDILGIRLGLNYPFGGSRLIVATK
jgi:SAM-dependent methyltransferase